MTINSLPDLSAKQLAAVLAVADNRSFIAGAAALRMSQPALSRTVKHVENTLGFELFSRTTRQVTVTSAGREFVALAQRLLEDLRLGVDNLRAQNTQPRGQLYVASVLLFSEDRLAPLLTDFRSRQSGIDIHFREGLHGHVLDDVASGLADFGITYLSSVSDVFIAEPLGVETLHVVLPDRHPLTRQPKIAIAALRDQSLVSYPVDALTRRTLDGLAAASGFALRHAVTVTRAATMLSMVRGGIGLGVVPSSERPTKGERQITSRPLLGAPIARLGTIRLRQRELSPAARELHQIMKQWIRLVAPRRLRAASR